MYIVTDGGFLTPWYSKVRALNWHMIGRLRGTMKCKRENQSQWQNTKAALGLMLTIYHDL